MNEARDAEIRALKDLRASSGWQYFTHGSLEQWRGELFVGRMKLALGSRTGVTATETIAEVFAGRTAVEGCLSWVDLRIKKLEADAAAEDAQIVEPVRRA